MVQGYLVDTDWLIDAIHGLSEAVRTLNTLAASGIAISLISFGELYEGAYYARTQPAALSSLRALLQGKVLLPLDESVMERFGIIWGQLSRPLRQ